MQGRNFFAIRRVRHSAADRCVLAPVGIFCPGVEAKVDGRKSRARLSFFGDNSVRTRRDEDAARVAQPDAVRWPTVKSDILLGRVGAIKQLANLPLCRGVVY